MKKQIIKIALYDGYRKLPNGVFQKGIGTKANFYSYWHLSNVYGTDLNELHRVALDVIKGLFSVYTADDGNEDDSRDIPLKYVQSIEHAMCRYRPIRSRYTHLIKAVADGIDYLNSKKL